MTDSILIDWNNNDINGGNGGTFDGKAIPQHADLVDVVCSVVRVLMTRMSIMGVRGLDQFALVVSDRIVGDLVKQLFVEKSLDGRQDLVEVTKQTLLENIKDGRFGHGLIFCHGKMVHIATYQDFPETFAGVIVDDGDMIILPVAYLDPENKGSGIWAVFKMLCSYVSRGKDHLDQKPDASK